MIATKQKPEKPATRRLTAEARVAVVERIHLPSKGPQAPPKSTTSELEYENSRKKLEEGAHARCEGERDEEDSWVNFLLLVSE